jgi:hypothetical protein
MDDPKKIELDTFNKFKKTGETKYFQQLYTSMKPLIYKAAEGSTYGSNLPLAAHRVYTANVFLDALKTYNPNSGAALATHVYAAVKNKSKRLNYEYGQLGAIPEPRAIKVGIFLNETANLRNELGRSPSAAEIADRMNIGVREVTRLQKEVTKDLGMDEGTTEIAFAEGSKEEETLYHLYFDLTADEKVAFEYLTGRYGKPKLSKNNRPDYKQISVRTGFSESKLRTLVASIKKKYEKVAR